MVKSGAERRNFKEEEMKGFFKALGYDPIKKQTNVKTEVIAGIVTFLAMAYILTVNPNQILVGADPAYWPSVFIATALGAIIGTLLMAFLAKMPLAQASGMGLNSLLGGLVAIWAADTYGVQFTLGQAFMMVLISGVIFLLLTLIKINGNNVHAAVYKLAGYGLAVPTETEYRIRFIFLHNSNSL